MNNVKTTHVEHATADTGQVRVGAAWRLTPVFPASIKDAGRVKLGAAWRLLPPR